MEHPQDLAALPIERLQAISDSQSFSLIPNTETAPGGTEGGTIASASADMLPTPDPISSAPEDEPITGGIDISNKRRQAVLSRIQNLRDAQAAQEGLA